MPRSDSITTYKRATTPTIRSGTWRSATGAAGPGEGVESLDGLGSGCCGQFSIGRVGYVGGSASGRCSGGAVTGIAASISSSYVVPPLGGEALDGSGALEVPIPLPPEGGTTCAGAETV